MTQRRPYKARNSWQRGALRRAVFAQHGAACAWCRWPGTDGLGKHLHLAHIVPWPAGPETPENLLPMCPSHHRWLDSGRLVAQRDAGGRLVLALAADTPTPRECSGARPQPSHGAACDRRSPAQNEISGGVGAGSPALPPGYQGVWGDLEELEELARARQ
jgi:hypothetical protein